MSNVSPTPLEWGRVVPMYREKSRDRQPSQTLFSSVYRCVLAVAMMLAFAMVLAVPSPVSATTLPSGFAETRLPYNLSFPSSMAIAPDGRVFVGERSGSLRIFKNDILLTTPFTTVTTATDGERGLIGITFDPAFESNGYVYICYTATTPTIHNRVSRFTADPQNPDVALPNSEFVVLDLDNLVSNQHNSGAIHFGKDGKLYIAAGDNYDSTNAQVLTNIKGKILRINADGTIPTDNPFYNSTTGKNKAIWSFGLRNPYTFDIQPGSGQILIDDVGHMSWEEINEGAAGANFGWPTTEGYTSDPRYTSPAFAYPHGDGDTSGCAITGGAFYNPATNPAVPQSPFPNQYVGKFFFLDFCNGWIRVLDPVTRSVSGFATGLTQANTVYIDDSPNGSLYYMTTADAAGVGAVFKIRYTGSLAPQIGSHPANQIVSVGYSGTFSVTSSGNQPFTYQWQKSTDGGATFNNIAGATADSYTTPATTMSDNGTKFRCVVTNSYGADTSNSATMTVTTNQPPTGTITAPAAGTYYNAGDTINYAGTGTDPETGTLPASAFTWEIRFEHHPEGDSDHHYHPVLGPISGVTSGSFTIPTTGDTATDTWYRIYLTVRDSVGLTHTSYRDILPRTSTITLATNPLGLLVTLDGGPETAPYSTSSVVGLTRSLGVISPQTYNDVIYEFVSWSDGGAATHNIATPANDTTYTAVFRNARAGTITASPNPIQICDGSGLGVTTLTWNSKATSTVEVHVGSPTGSLLARTSTGTWSTTTGKWVKGGTVFYLQDVSNGLPLTAANTLSTVTVQTTSAGCTGLSGTLSASPNPIIVCDGTGNGVTTLSWTSTKTINVEVRIGSPSGPLFSRSGPGSATATTGKWVKNNTTFYLQDVSGGLPLTAANTLATTTVNVTTVGCRQGSVSASPNPIELCSGTTGATSLFWNSVGPTAVEMRIGSPSGPLFSRSGPGSAAATTGKWVSNGTSFYLQDVSGGLPLTAANTLATTTVNTVTSTRCGTLAASPNPIPVCDGSGVGVTTLSWSSSGTTTVEVHIGSPTGALFASSPTGSWTATTGKWVKNGMVFYLQDVSGGKALTAANTLATIVANTTATGCP